LLFKPKAGSKLPLMDNAAEAGEAVAETVKARPLPRAVATLVVAADREERHPRLWPSSK